MAAGSTSWRTAIAAECMSAFPPTSSPESTPTRKAEAHATSPIFGKTRLVYAGRHEQIESAIAREKLVKKWRREWKFALIEAENPDWRDLWDEWFAAEA